MRSARPFRILMLLLLASCGFLASEAEAYVGPGAGVGTPSGFGVGSLIVLLVAVGIGLCVLCGLVALAIGVSRKVRSLIAARSPPEGPPPLATDRPRP